MLLSTAKFFLYLSLFSILVVLTATFFPFIGGKYYFFRVSIELSLMFLLFSWAFEMRRGELETKLKRLVRRPLFIAVSIFAVAFLLATLFAHSPGSAFWSNYERGEGGFQMIHYYVFFMLLALLFDREEEWHFAMKLMLAAAFFMILYGILGYISLICIQNHQLAGDPSPQASCPNFFFVTPYSSGTVPQGAFQIFTKARFQGTLGNPAYVAPYLLFSIFYAAWLWFEGRKTAWKHFLFGALEIYFLIFFILSQTRGAFLGLGAAIFIVLIYLFIAEKRFRLPLILLAIFVTVFAFGAKKYCDANATPSHPVPVCRLVQIDTHEQTFQTRLWTWGSAFKGFQDRPIFGWGPENFSAVFDKHFDPRHYQEKDSETWFDRAHNVVVDYLVETGVVGVLAYLGIFVVFYWQFQKALRHLRLSHAHEKSKHREHSPLTLSFFQALLFAIPVGYLIQGIALFDVLPIYINLFFLMAFAQHEFAAPYSLSRT